MVAIIWAKLGKWAAALGAVCVAIISLFYAGKKSGEAKILEKDVEAANEALKKQEETIKGAQDAQKTINKLSFADVADKLRSKWSRKD